MFISMMPASARIEQLLTPIDPCTGSYPSGQSSPERRSNHLLQRQVNGVLDSRGSKYSLRLSESMFVDLK